LGLRSLYAVASVAQPMIKQRIDVKKEKGKKKKKRNNKRISK